MTAKKPKLEIVAPPPTDAGRMRALFLGHGGAYGTHGEPTQAPGSLKWEIKTTARTHKGPTTTAMWAAHLAGTKPLGIIPITEDSMCWWACIDVDKYDIDLLPIIKAVEDSGLPLVCARSKSGGLRIYLFLSEPRPAALVLAVMRDIAARLGLAECEIFPKQTNLVGERGDLGNWMVMPYYGDTFGGKIKAQVGLKPSGEEMALADFLDLAESRRQSPEQVEALRPATGPGAALSGPAQTRQSGVAGGVTDLTDGPPCLERIAEGLAEYRNNALTHAGIFLKRKYPDWEDRVEQYNQIAMRPPLTSDEVVTIKKSLRKKDYEYTCHVRPMCGLCDSTLCRTRRYGVGQDHGDDYPTIEGFTVTRSEQPVWRMKLAGVERRLTFVKAEEFTDFKKFNNECVRQASRFFPPSKAVQGYWTRHISEWVRRAVPVTPPAGVTPFDQFWGHLAAMLVEHWQGGSIEDVLRGKPFEDQKAGCIYFQLKDVYNYLRREGMEDVTFPKVADWLHQAEARQGENGKPDGTQIEIKGKRKRLWYISASRMRAESDPPISPPRGKDRGVV